MRERMSNWANRRECVNWSNRKRMRNWSNRRQRYIEQTKRMSYWARENEFHRNIVSSRESSWRSSQICSSMMSCNGLTTRTSANVSTLRYETFKRTSRNDVQHMATRITHCSVAATQCCTQLSLTWRYATTCSCLRAKNERRIPIDKVIVGFGEPKPPAKRLLG